MVNKTSLLLFLVYFIVSSSGYESFEVNIDWTDILNTNKIIATLQICYDPLLLPESPYSDKIWNLLSDLNNIDFIRFQTTSDYPKIGVTQLTPPSGEYLCDYINGDSYHLQFNNITLKCLNSYSVIDKIQFASYGDPIANNDIYCGNWTIGQCHSNSTKTIQIVQELCEGKNQCTFNVNNHTFPPLSCYNKNGYQSFAVQVNCTNNSMNSNFNNFDNLDKIITNLMKYGINNHTSNIIFNLETIPAWLYGNVTSNEIYSYMTDNIYWDSGGNYPRCGDGWNEQQYNGLNGIGEYFGKYVSWYLNDGFIDKYGIKHKSGFNYSWNNHNDNKYNVIFEVLNEPDYASYGGHVINVEQYTKVYDIIIEGIWNEFDINHEMKFVGLVLGGANGGDNYEWYTYFLNKTNHKSHDIPLDYISFHFYAVTSECTDFKAYQQLFDLTDGFIQEIPKIISIKNSLSPTTQIIIDEMGAILSTQCSEYNGNLPEMFWLSSGGVYAYIFGKLSSLINEKLVIAESGLIFHGKMNSTLFPPSEEGLNSFCQSTTMIDWNTGDGNARYWILKLILDNFSIGDTVINTTILSDNNGDNNNDVFIQGYLTKNDKSKRILIVNKLYDNVDILINDNDIKQNGGKLYVVDEMTGNGPARIETIKSNNLTINPFGVAVFCPN